MDGQDATTAGQGAVAAAAGNGDVRANGNADRQTNGYTDRRGDDDNDKLSPRPLATCTSSSIPHTPSHVPSSLSSSELPLSLSGKTTRSGRSAGTLAVSLHA